MFALFALEMGASVGHGIQLQGFEILVIATTLQSINCVPDTDYTLFLIMINSISKSYNIPIFRG